MELEVNSEAVAVETVEVVAGGGEDSGAAAALMGQQLMVGNTQDLMVPEVCVFPQSIWSCVCILCVCSRGHWRARGWR